VLYEKAHVLSARLSPAYYGLHAQTVGHKTIPAGPAARIRDDAKRRGETKSYSGKFLDILEKQADGSWKIAIDCFNLDAPPALVGEASGEESLEERR
jgi:hypothetical protein